MAAKDRKHYAKVKADPIAYAEYRARKNREAKARGWDRERHAIGKRKWRANNPVKAQTLRRAHHAVEEAVKRGRLIRPNMCSDCGGSDRIQAHHESYAPEHWLTVVWLCEHCHVIRHHV